MILDKITESEYKMMHIWRDWYGWCDERSSTCQLLPIRDILNIEYASAKQDLYKLFGEKLILSKDVEFKKPTSKLDDEMWSMCHQYATYGREERMGLPFVQAYNEMREREFPVYHHYMWEVDTRTPEQRAVTERNAPIASGLCDLIATKCLIDNVYNGQTFIIPLPNGKELAVNHGCKPIKMLGKIADAFNIPHFEDFRICHSLILNQKKLSGKLHISIHPLDYWTMSDNKSGWDSCMNWRDFGGYRQGTVEMMNSPFVVVAYLSGSQELCIGKDSWNDKKWRELFIVNEHTIFAVKGYPYHSDDLQETTMKWLRDLAKENMGWEYTTEEPLEHKYETYFTNPEKSDKEFKVQFITCHMYNDVGSGHHKIFIGKALNPEEADIQTEKPSLMINYSGESQCIACGKVGSNTVSFSDSGCVCCVDCEESLRCAECGERIYRDDAICVNGVYYCECCYDNLSIECGICNDYYFEDEMASLYFLLRPDKELNEFADKWYGKCVDFHEGYEHGYVSYYAMDVCPHCMEHHMQHNIKSGAKIYNYRSSTGERGYAVYIDDLTENFLEYIDLTYLQDKALEMSTKDLFTKYFDGNQGRHKYIQLS